MNWAANGLLRTTPSTTDPLFVGGLTIGLILIHLLPRWLQPSDEEDRRWLSVVSGIVIAFVFLELLPGIVELAEIAADSGAGLGAALGEHIYVIVLGGFLAYYGIETAVDDRTRAARPTEPVLFWTHIGMFALYNFLVGYKLAHHHVFIEAAHVSLFFLALGVHFLLTDFGLLEHHGDRYLAVGRWVVVAGIAVGAIAGVFLQINADIALVAALLAGGILFNTLNHEIEAPSQTNYLLLVASATVFGAILVVA